MYSTQTSGKTLPKFLVTLKSHAEFLVEVFLISHSYERPGIWRVSVDYRIRQCNTIYPPLGHFSLLDISTVGIVSVPKGSALESSRPELTEDPSFDIGTNRAWKTAPSEYDIHRPIRVRCCCGW